VYTKFNVNGFGVPTTLGALAFPTHRFHGHVRRAEFGPTRRGGGEERRGGSFFLGLFYLLSPPPISTNTNARPLLFSDRVRFAPLLRITCRRLGVSRPKVKKKRIFFLCSKTLLKSLSLSLSLLPSFPPSLLPSLPTHTHTTLHLFALSTHLTLALNTPGQVTRGSRAAAGRQAPRRTQPLGKPAKSKRPP